jgi:hypothetical protein
MMFWSIPYLCTENRSEGVRYQNPMPTPETTPEPADFHGEEGDQDEDEADEDKEVEYTDSRSFSKTAPADWTGSEP